MPVNALEPTDQRFVSELPSYIRESRALLNQVEILAEADAINIENVVNVGSAYNVENADVVDTAENIETATNVTNATTIENAETVTNSVGDITTVQAVENNTGDITNAVTVRNADLVTNAELVTGDIATVTTIEHASNCTITHADVVNDFGGVTASAADINTACDGDTAKNNHTHQLADGADDVTLSAAEINDLPGDLTDHADLTDPHSSTSLATPERIPLRDVNGNFAVGDALADTDVVNRQTGDGRYAALAGNAGQTFLVDDATDDNHAINRQTGDDRYGVYEEGSTSSPGGQVTSGTVRWVRIGNSVTISWTDLGHASGLSCTTGAIIPSAFRPTEGQLNVYSASAAGINTVVVNTDGTMQFYYRDWSGNTTNKTSTTQGSISYAIA